jgi:polar amino acid transport system substrate-binding protein
MPNAYHLVLCAAVALAVAGCQRAPEDQDTSAGPRTTDVSCQLTMGWDPWEPYHYMDPKGQHQGLDFELVRAIAAEGGCRIDFERDSWANLLAKIRTGEIDLISGATLTPEREEYAWFSQPYRTERFALFVRSGDANRFTGDTLKALLAQGMRVGVTDAYIYGPAVQALQDDPAYAGQFVVAAVGETSATRLLDGVIDGFLEDIFVATSVLRRRGLEALVEEHPLQLETGGDVRLMFSRASVPAEEVERFNTGLERLRENGRYETIEGQYIR